MDHDLINGKFARIGARVKLRRSPLPGRLRIDVRSGPHGEYFDIALDVARPASLRVLDVQPQGPHLLLLAEDDPHAPARLREGKQKFLCGHDERHWFVAAIPESAAAADVRGALDALKPPAVREAEDRAGVKPFERYRRRTNAFVRQGEWFFIPAPDIRVSMGQVLRNEPLRRGGGKPHRVQYCWRRGGESVWVSRVAPNGFTGAEYARWRKEHPGAHVRWTAMRRNPEVYVRGTVKHADHATIRLAGWHRVEMNTETSARAMAGVAFLD
jgi:hypothetical protein